MFDDNSLCTEPLEEYDPGAIEIAYKFAGEYNILENAGLGECDEYDPGGVQIEEPPVEYDEYDPEEYDEYDPGCVQIEEPPGEYDEYDTGASNRSRSRLRRRTKMSITTPLECFHFGNSSAAPV